MPSLRALGNLQSASSAIIRVIGGLWNPFLGIPITLPWPNHLRTGRTWRNKRLEMGRWHEFCPAKVNLYLAVTGRRGDGYHDLLSLVAPLDFGDNLHADLSPSGEDELTCTDASLPVDASNLVLKAAAAYRRRVRLAPALAFHLDKRVPHGAGLGGGSSDAAGALRILNAAARGALSPEELAAVAAEVGSDCPLFLHPGPVIIRGRGEIVEALPPAAAAALSGLPLVLIKPHFAINTGWAYRDLAERHAYVPADQAEADLASWLGGVAASMPSPPLYNSFQQGTYSKYLNYPAINDLLWKEGLPPATLSGSGSACFCVCGGDAAQRVEALAEEAFGLGCVTLQTLVL